MVHVARMALVFVTVIGVEWIAPLGGVQKIAQTTELVLAVKVVFVMSDFKVQIVPCRRVQTIAQ